MDDGLQRAIERGELDWTGFHAAFCRKSGSTPDPTALAHAASDMFRLNVGMLPVLAACQRLGVPTGVLSNTCDPHWRFLASGAYAILPGRFRTIVLSHEVGAVKPEPEIYALAARRAGVEPQRIFFCDDLPGHVEAARAAGWDAAIFESSHGLVEQLARRGLSLGL
jgi:putative hydrolase of the HAD superfamily